MRVGSCQLLTLRALSNHTAAVSAQSPVTHPASTAASPNTFAPLGHQFKDSTPLCSSLVESLLSGTWNKIGVFQKQGCKFRVSPVLGYRKESVLLVSSMGDVTWIISTSDSSFSSYRIWRTLPPSSAVNELTLQNYRTELSVIAGINILSGADWKDEEKSNKACDSCFIKQSTETPTTLTSVVRREFSLPTVRTRPLQPAPAADSSKGDNFQIA